MEPSRARGQQRPGAGSGLALALAFSGLCLCLSLNTSCLFTSAFSSPALALLTQAPWASPGDPTMQLRLGDEPLEPHQEKS